jgi:hypothetical protein
MAVLYGVRASGPSPIVKQLEREAPASDEVKNARSCASTLWRVA